MRLQLVRIVDDLPDGFAALRAEAEAEGHCHMTRLAEEWSSDAANFLVLIAAMIESDLIGIGGLTREPQATAAVRMRRLYVSASARRAGVGRALANALLQEALNQAGLITVHAGGDDAAAFWEAMGFVAVQDRPWSHELRRP